MTEHIFQHLGLTWTIACPNDKWYAQSEHFALAGPFDSEVIAHSWIKALISSGTGVPLQSYPATPKPLEEPVAASHTHPQGIPWESGDSYRVPGQSGDVYTPPECVTPHVTPPVADPRYYVPRHDGTVQHMTYDEILRELGPEQTERMFRPGRIGTDPDNPPGLPQAPKPLSRVGAIFRMLGLRT